MYYTPRFHVLFDKYAVYCVSPLALERADRKMLLTINAVRRDLTSFLAIVSVSCAWSSIYIVIACMDSTDVSISYDSY